MPQKLHEHNYPAPSHEQKVGNLDDDRLAKISNDRLLDGLSTDVQREIIGDTFELYTKAKETLAPVITDFADSLLAEAGADKQIIFAARDGLGAYSAAKSLLEKFPTNYIADPKQLAYLYFTRAVTFNSYTLLQEYVEQSGLNPQKPTLIADIGMYGSIMYDLQSVLPQSEARYLISRNPSIPGFAVDALQHKTMASLKSISGNPAIHFLEDTFSGTSNSPKQLVRLTDGLIVPDMATGRDAYPAVSEHMKRKYATMVFTDYVAELSSPPSGNQAVGHIHELDTFLSDTNQYKHLMVPHIR